MKGTDHHPTTDVGAKNACDSCDATLKRHWDYCPHCGIPTDPTFPTSFQG